MSNVQTTRRVYEAFGRRDIPAVLAMFDSSIEWLPAEGHPVQPDGSPWFGPEAVLQNLFLRLGGDWDGFTVTPMVFHDAGDTVVVEGRYTGTVLASGVGVDAQFCHVWTVRDDRMCRFQQYVDTGQLQYAMREVHGLGVSA